MCRGQRLLAGGRPQLLGQAWQVKDVVVQRRDDDLGQVEVLGSLERDEVLGAAALQRGLSQTLGLGLGVLCQKVGRRLFLGLEQVGVGVRLDDVASGSARTAATRLPRIQKLASAAAIRLAA